MLSEHFRRDEFVCQCGCGFAEVDGELVAVLEDVRSYFGKPVIINSGCRCPEHNRSEGGAEHSRHLTGKAADIRVRGFSADAVATYLETKYPGKYGIGRYFGRTHIDVRPGMARWDKRG